MSSSGFPEVHRNFSCYRGVVFQTLQIFTFPCPTFLFVIANFWRIRFTRNELPNRFMTTGFIRLTVKIMTTRIEDSTEQIFNWFNHFCLLML